MASVINTVKSTIVENFGGASHTLASEHEQFSLENDVPDLTGKVAVITGGSEGIGYGCSHTLLSHNLSKLYIIALSQEVFDGCLKDITSTLSADHARRVSFIKCDVGDWKAVAQASKKISSEISRLDILILDAARGIMTYDLCYQQGQSETSGKGLDRHMAVNHVGHVALASHLMPLMKETASKGNTVRIVTLGSNAHQATPLDCKFESVAEMNQDLGPNGQYGRSKLAQMLYVKYLTKHLGFTSPNLASSSIVHDEGKGGILANTVHPGFVDTKMSQDDIHEPYPVLGYGMSVGMKPFKKDQWMGCVSAVFAATKCEGSGLYICPPAIVEAGNELFQDKDEVLTKNLMSLTEQVVKEQVGSESVDKGCPLKFV